MQSFFRAQCFEVHYVNSATTYRAQFFSTQSKAGLAKFEIQDPKVIDHSYLGSIIYLNKNLIYRIRLPRRIV